jgi:hypothetical protein
MNVSYTKRDRLISSSNAKSVGSPADRRRTSGILLYTHQAKQCSQVMASTLSDLRMLLILVRTLRPLVVA